MHSDFKFPLSHEFDVLQREILIASEHKAAQSKSDHRVRQGFLTSKIYLTTGLAFFLALEE